MKASPFGHIVCDQESRRFFFLEFAYELRARGGSYSYGEPCYHDRNLGLSVVPTGYTDATYSYLELCVISMGHEPIPEAGPVRVVMFQSQNDRAAFRMEFDACYKGALEDLNKLGGMSPSDYYRTACFNEVRGVQDEAQSHSIMLAIDTGSELSRVLWHEHLKEQSDFPWKLQEYFNECPGHHQVRVEFRKKANRDHYVLQLSELKRQFTEACRAHGRRIHAGGS